MREAVWDELGPFTRLDQRNPEQLEQSPIVLTRLRLNLYNTKVLHIALVTLSLFLSSRQCRHIGEWKDLLA